jgi:hypothetical protein
MMLFCRYFGPRWTFRWNYSRQNYTSSVPRRIQKWRWHC